MPLAPPCGPPYRGAVLRAVILLACALGACGAPPVGPPPARMDVLHHVYLRGNAGENVALTFDGLGPCAPDLLARLKQPAEGLGPMRATFFIDPADPPDASLATRLEAEGHEVALWVPTVPAEWKASPEALRRGLTERAGELATVLSESGWRGGLPRFWRPGGSPDPFVLGRTADAERAVVLWSVYGEGATAAALAERVLPRLAAGEILAVPTSAPECPAVALVPDLAKTLGTTRQNAVPVGELLAVELGRHHPPQAVRYLGRGLPPGCAEALGRPVEGDAELERPRWGLVHDAADAWVRVLPVGGVGDSTEALLDGAALSLWAQRARWLAMPGCLRRVGPGHILSPIAGPQAPRWWAVGEEGLVERDARAAGAPGGVAVLPARADLVRIEARQRLPWTLRGLVADALERLSLDTPLLVEARVVPAVVVARPLGPQASPQEVEAALGAFTQVVELSLAEYLYLAMSSPADLGGLQRAARAPDGFLRPGPFLVLRQNGLPDGHRLGPDGTGFPQAAALVGRVLAGGHSLAPGDVISALPAPLLGAPMVGLIDEKRSRRARLRHGLARSILVGSSRPGYLRPGAVVRVEGDLLGVQEVRVAVPAGVAVPSPDAGPLRPAGAPPGAP